MTVDETVKLGTRLAQGTIVSGMAFVIEDVVFIVNASHGETFAFVDAGENGTYALGQSVIIADGFDGSLCGIACGDRCRQNENVLAHDHGGNIIAEDHLVAADVFGGNDVDRAVAVHIHVACTGQRTCHASADQLSAVQAKDGIDDLCIGDLSAKDIRADTRLGKTVLGHREIDVIIQVAVSGGEMTFCQTQGEIRILVRKCDQLDCHNILLRRLPHEGIRKAYLYFVILYHKDA